MKKQFTVVVCMFVSVISMLSPLGVFAQTTNASQPVCWNDLRNTRCVNVLSNQHKRWTLEFTDMMMTNTYFYGKSGNSYPKTYKFYLSDKIPTAFENNKVGKKTSGHYIISLIDDELVSNQILSLTANELRIRLAHSGDTLVFVREQ